MFEISVRDRIEKADASVLVGLKPVSTGTAAGAQTNIAQHRKTEALIPLPGARASHSANCCDYPRACYELDTSEMIR